MRATMRTGVRRRPGRWLVALSATTAVLLSIAGEALGPTPTMVRLTALMAAAATGAAAAGAASVLLRHRRYGPLTSR